MTLYTRFAAHLDAALDSLVSQGALPAGLERRAVTVEPPRDPTHGDVATNAAMVLAKTAGTNPRALAERIAAELGALEGVESVAVAGPGFINRRVTGRSEERRVGIECVSTGRTSCAQDH